MQRRDFLKGTLAAGTGLWGVIGHSVPVSRLISSHPGSGSVTPVELRVEALLTPVTDARAPRLSWKLMATEDARNQVQTAYRIVAATTEEKLVSDAPDLWDTGKVVSDQQLHVPYDGKALSPGQRCFWRVEVWDGEDMRSIGSDAAWWEQGIGSPTEWDAQWISSGKELPDDEAAFYDDAPAPLFRRTFRIDKPVQKARWYATALGYVALRCNGTSPSEDVLSPAWTHTPKTLYYTCHDITHLLRVGDNVVGAILGNGWRNPLPLRMWGRINIREHLPVGTPQLLSVLVIDYVDGTTERIGSDTSWLVSDGPLLRNSVYLGETYDARLEQPGWDAPGFDDGIWGEATIEGGTPREIGSLKAQPVPPIRRTQQLDAGAWNEVRPGVWIVDFGRNIAGWVRLRVEGPRGTTVTLRMGELLYGDGTLNPMTAVAGQIKRQDADGVSIGGPGAPTVAEQTLSYTLKGDGLEEYEPHFTFHGFRYVEMTGFPGRPPKDALQAVRLNTDVARSGSFRCSNDMFNRLDEVARGTLLSNLFSVQSDCPAREKFQYGGDIVSSSEMAIYSFDMAAFYAKVVGDFRDSAIDGWFTETAPFVGIQAANYQEGAGPIGWGLAHPLLLDQLFRYYGDKRLMEEHYTAARTWVNLLAEKADGYIVDRCIGDHESLDPKPIALMATAQFYQAVTLIGSFARTLGRAEESAYYNRLAENIRSAFIDRFLAPGTGRFGSATQASQATALYMGLVPDGEHALAVKRMIEAVVDDHGGHIAAGIFGTKYLLNALTSEGYADVAYQLVDQRSYPGWGYMLENGATTLWETWAQSDNTYSQNHPMFGSVVEWLYRCIGGINPTMDAAGFDRMLIAPHITKALTFADVTYDSVRGVVAVKWSRKAGIISLDVQVPVNTRATVRLPALTQERIREGGRRLEDAEAISIRSDAPKGFVDIEVGSGHYRFSIHGS